MRVLAALALALLAPLAAAPPADAARPAEAERFLNQAGLAIEGFDPVSFQTAPRPLRGKSAIEVTWEDVRWRFATEANRALFEADPAKYAPRFGGYCAWAMAQGRLEPGNPANWSVLDGALYLFLSPSTQKKWLADPQKAISQAQNHWPNRR